MARSGLGWATRTVYIKRLLCMNMGGAPWLAPGNYDHLGSGQKRGALAFGGMPAGYASDAGRRCRPAR
ncbi:hypothetical protein XAP7430_770024 [Xanthomonas phaseoli pv. phaseoli]|uniref:Uncharacterized protein n=1 Tax=Xanthomonas campestris pv. phaseoli TaxID=317013 RepID=A0AB38E4S9_XANCH|nr:hypothetical protein XAP7430_770024 [Xanthomonas phaseoli pv. phaseoli]